MGQTQHLVPCGLHGAGLMDIDVGGVRAQSTLVRPQGRVNHRQIGLGASHQKVDGNVLTAAFVSNFGCSGGAVFVLPVAQGLGQVGFNQPGQHLRMAALAVVIVEIDHLVHAPFSPFYPFWNLVSRAHTAALSGIPLFQHTASEVAI